MSNKEGEGEGVDECFREFSLFLPLGYIGCSESDYDDLQSFC